MKKYLSIIIKFLLATFIIFYLINSGRLNFQIILKAITTNTLTCIAAYILFIFIIFLGTLRWNGFLRKDSHYRGNIFHYIKLTYIGLFFNPLLPGAVSGDLVKLYYTYRDNRNFSKSHLVSTIFLDRLFGLLALLIIFLASILYGLTANNSIFEITEFKILTLFTLSLLVFVALICILIFTPSTERYALQKTISKIPLIGRPFNKLINGFRTYGGDYTLGIRSLIISLFCQFLNLLAFYIITKPFLSETISFTDFLLIVPAGIIVSAIPITPLGIGIGHAFFIFLFNIVGQTNGADLFNLYLLLILVTDLTGAFFYLFSFRNLRFHSLKEISNLFKSEVKSS